MKRVVSYIMLVALLSLMACSKGRTPHSAAEFFYESIAASEYDQALSITTLADDADPEIYYAIMEKVSRSIAERGGVESVDVVDEQIADDGSRAVVTTLINYVDGSRQEEVCDVVMVEDGWRVDVNLDSK